MQSISCEDEECSSWLHLLLLLSFPASIPVWLYSCCNIVWRVHETQPLPEQFLREASTFAVFITLHRLLWNFWKHTDTHQGSSLRNGNDRDCESCLSWRWVSHCIYLVWTELVFHTQSPFGQSTHLSLLFCHSEDALQLWRISPGPLLHHDCQLCQMLCGGFVPWIPLTTRDRGETTKLVTLYSYFKMKLWFQSKSLIPSPFSSDIVIIFFPFGLALSGLLCSICPRKMSNFSPCHTYILAGSFLQDSFS